MRQTQISLPELALIAGTRAIAGAGLGLLLADHLPVKQRKAIGWTMFLVGAAATVPLLVDVLEHSFPSRVSEWERRNMELLPI
jgi:hypothetical protein